MKDSPITAKNGKFNNNKDKEKKGVKLMNRICTINDKILR